MQYLYIFGLPTHCLCGGSSIKKTAQFGGSGKENSRQERLESVRIGKSQNRKVSELEIVRIIWSFKDSLQMSQLMFNKQFRYMTCAKRSLLYHGLHHNGYISIICPIFKESEHSDTFQFWHFPISSKMGNKLIDTFHLGWSNLLYERSAVWCSAVLWVFTYVFFCLANLRELIFLSNKIQSK